MALRRVELPLWHFYSQLVALSNIAAVRPAAQADLFVGHSVAAIIGALAVIAEPSRFAKLVMLTPSPRYIDDSDYRGGFTQSDIDELLESMELNYLGWSRAMAPVTTLSSPMV